MLRKEQKENQTKTHDQTIRELKSTLQKAKKAEQTKKNLEPKYRELLSLRKEIPKLEIIFKKSQQAENQITILKNQINGLKTNLETEIRTGKESLERLMVDKSSAEQAKTNQEKLQAKYDELLALKKELPELEKADKKSQQTSNQIEILKTKFNSEKENLERQIKNEKKALEELETQKQETNKQIQKLPLLNNQVKSLSKQVKNKQEYQKIVQELREERAKIGQQISNLSRQSIEKETEWNDIEKLGVGAPCPRCHQQLTEKHYKRLEKEYQKEIRTITQKIESDNKELENTNKKIKENTEKLAQINIVEEEILATSREIQTLKTIKERYTADEQRIRSKEKTIKQLEDGLEEETFAAQINKEMETLKETLASLEEPVEEYSKVRTAILDHETNNIEPSYISSKTQAEKLPKLKKLIETCKKQVNELELNLKNETYAIEKKEEIKNHNKTIIQLKEDVESYYSTKATIETYEQEEVEALYTKAETESKRIPEIKTSITNNKKKMEELRAEIKDLEKNLEQLEEKIKSMGKIPTELEQLELENGILRTNRATQDQIIKGSREVVQGINSRLESLNKDLERHQDNIEEANVLRITESWISQVLLPSIQSIEKNVLYTINQEFNKLFKRWFSSLIESDELQGFIDQDFTPIVEQGGYELEVESLSGGEKTSVALAYRLALNTIVKQVTNTMKSNLLILDEPTDGFSKEQLNKLHDILNELGCNQVILVSHEKELETVADSIYRVNKFGNISRVTHP